MTLIRAPLRCDFCWYWTLSLSCCISISPPSLSHLSLTERKQFKQVTLAILYGMSINQVARKLGITKSAAVAATNDFYRRFRGIKTWMDRVKSQARRDLYVTTIAGRRRYLDDINSDDGNRRAQAERQSVNTVIQGSAADLMKLAMVNLARSLKGWTAGGGGSEPRIL